MYVPLSIMGKECWLVDADEKAQRAGSWVLLNGVSLAEAIFSPSLPLAIIYWMYTVLGTWLWTRQKPTSVELTGFVWGCSTEDLMCGERWVSSLPKCTTWASWEQEPLGLPARDCQSRPHFCFISWFSMIKQWFCWSQENKGSRETWGRVISPLNLLGLQLYLSSPGNSVYIHMTTPQGLCVCVGRI